MSELCSPVVMVLRTQTGAMVAGDAGSKVNTIQYLGGVSLVDDGSVDDDR